MGLLGKFKGKRDDDDNDDDLDGLDEESFDDDEPSTGLLGRMRQKLKPSGSDDDDGEEDDTDGLSDEDDGSSSGIFGRMRRKFKRDADDDGEDDDELDMESGDPVGGGDAPAVPVSVTPPPFDTPATTNDGENKVDQAPGEAPTAVSIVGGPEGGEPPDATGGPMEGNAENQDTAAKGGSDGGAGSGLDLSDIFESEEQVDEAFKDLVDSVGDIGASELATQLRDLMVSLDKGG
ncbi:MAG: hypothetical protein BZY80_01460 [SAR202 cluster bacterium Io17-Chloro-G2]|nr:MAG: hypothetical protein BZY80_01460 [SAR202 cluster bacterium Io17-Chloro-G2]